MTIIARVGAAIQQLLGPVCEATAKKCGVKSLRRSIIELELPHIEQILQENTKAPKKQRYTAMRIWQRLRDEHGFSGGESTIRTVVRKKTSTRKEVFLPLSHPPGEAHGRRW